MDLWRSAASRLRIDDATATNIYIVINVVIKS
jgi:hypothetical protein